jgi:GNAT superfamily N-acetyltransferase
VFASDPWSLCQVNPSNFHVGPDMNTSLTVRRLAGEQAALYRELRIAALREAPYAFGTTLSEALAEDEETLGALVQQLARSDQRAGFVLYTEGQPAGLVGAFFEEGREHRGFIRALWVAPAVRHLRGGELLVSAATRWLIDHGSTLVYAWVTDANVNAMQFYLRLGFTPSGDRQSLPSNPNEWETLLFKAV